jgi:hypothetical protein
MEVRGSGSPGGAGAAPDLERDAAAVLELLEPDQIVAAKGLRFGRRPLSPGVRFVLWALRVYVLLMLAVVVVAVLRGLHGGG